MTKRRLTIIKQKLVGLLMMMAASPLANITDGDLTLPIAVICLGLVLVGCNETFEEITRKMTKKEIEEIQREKEDL